MTQIIGLEGRWPDDVLVAWGAAALLLDDGMIRNTITGAVLPQSDWHRLIQHGHAYSLPEPIPIRLEYTYKKMLVVGIRGDRKSHDLFLPDTGRTGGIVASKRSRRLLFYVFMDRDSFDSYSGEVAASIAWNVLKQKPDEPNLLELVTAGLLIAPIDAQLHALRVVLSTNRERTLAVARAILSKSTGIQLFEGLLRALDADQDVDYWINYHDGIAEGGGLDVDTAVKQLGALSKIQKRLIPILQSLYPFLQSEESIPSYRLRQLKAASADLGFGVSLEGRPLIDRVARYLEIQLLQEVLRGNLPKELTDDREFLEDLHQLCRPSPETTVRQRPLQKSEDEAVVFEPFDEPTTARHDTTIRALCYIEGAYKQLRRIEVRLGPEMGAIVVSTEKTANDSTPAGAHLIQQDPSRFLFRPSLVYLDRYVDDQSRYRWYLSSIDVLSEGESVEIVDTPSAIVSGAFFRGPVMRLEKTGLTEYAVGGATFQVADPPTPAGARQWLQRFSQISARHELEHGLLDDVSWCPPAKVRPPSALMRILLVLNHTADGRLLLPELISRVNRIAEAHVRRGNTRRELKNNPELVTIDMEDDEVICITDLGRRHAQIYLRIVPEIAGDLAST